MWDMCSLKTCRGDPGRRTEMVFVVFLKCGGIHVALFASNAERVLHVSGSLISSTSLHIDMRKNADPCEVRTSSVCCFSVTAIPQRTSASGASAQIPRRVCTTCPEAWLPVSSYRLLWVLWTSTDDVRDNPSSPVLALKSSRLFPPTSSNTKCFGRRLLDIRATNPAKSTLFLRNTVSTPSYQALECASVKNSTC